jgi:hypothetical protein
MWREEDSVAKLVDSVLDGYGQQGPDHGKDDSKGDNKKKRPNIKQCLRKVADGHFAAVVKVLGSSEVAPCNEDTMKILGDKHPYNPPLSMPTTMFLEAPLVADVDTVLGCI